MTDINTRGKLPFTVVSSSVNTGYAAELTAAVGQNIDLVNHHRDEYGQLENSPAQGPFTHQHVGGSQHRHVNINTGNDNPDNRAEGYYISASQNSIKVYGPDIKGVDKPRSILSRDFTAKSPVNIKNIATSGNIAGNFEQNYQVIQNVGRRLNNNLIVDGFEASGSLTTKFVSSSQQIYTLPDITRIDAEGSEYKDKTTIVQRFNAPGGKEESSRGALDREGEEYAPNNSLTTRNIKTRQPYYNQLTYSNKKFYLNNEIPFATDINVKISKSFYVGTLENSPLALYFKEDGTEFFYTGFQNKLVRRYQMAIPYDIETATPLGSTDISAQALIPRALTFSADGTKMYVGSVTSIFRYNLSTPWDITTKTFVNSSNFGATVTGVYIDSTGTRLFLSFGSTSISIIKEFTLSSAWDITASVLKSQLDVSPQQSTISGFAFDYTGFELFIVGIAENKIHKYSLNNDKELETAKYISSFTIKEESGIQDICLSSQKNKLYIIGSGQDTIFQYDLDSNIFGEHSVNKNSLNKIEFSGSTAITGNRNDNFWVQHSIPRTDLRYKWIADSVSSSQQPIEYQSYNLPYSTSSYYNSNGAFQDLDFELKGPFGDHLGISGAIDKDEMFVSTYTNTMYRDRKYFEFNETNTYVDLSSVSSDITEKDFTISFWMKSDDNINYDLSKAIKEHSFSVASENTKPEGIFFKPDGTTAYFIGNLPDRIYQYSLTVPWDISTMSFEKTGSVSSKTLGPTGLYIKPDGTKVYISSVDTNKIIEYNLSTPWDISTTGSAVVHSFLEDPSPQDIFFKSDGTKIYIVGSSTLKLYQKNLSTAWDLTTTGSATTSSLPITQPRAFSLSEDGKRLIVLDDSTNKIYYFTLEENWNINSALTLIQNYSLDISAIDVVGTGLFINEYQEKLYFIGQFNSKLHQFKITYEPLPLFQYSGSSSDNNLLLEISPSSSNIFLSGSGVSNSIKSNPNINDNKWHLITLASDKAMLPTRISDITGVPRNSTLTKIYIDGGLATEATQLYKTINISGLFLSSRDKVNLARSGYNLHDIMLWNSALTEEQINQIYRTSKSSYGELPKKYFEHKLDNVNIPAPIHVYSARINEDNLTLIDEVGNKNGNLVNFTSSINLQPQNIGIISYSTYFDGPYQGSSWKMLKKSEHPVTRKLNTENTNIISVLKPSIRNSFLDQSRTLLGHRIKDGDLLNIKESPVITNNKPLKHKFVLKDSSNRNIAFEMTHTYGNNLQYFANENLNLVLGLDKKEKQVYDKLLEYYDGTLPDSENPIEKLVGYTYSEVIFPKPGQGLLKDVRQRTDYITDEPGYSIDGYDRQLGTQRVFWRDEQQDRMRTVNSYINSLGNTFDSIYLDLPFQTPSIAAFEFISESKTIQYSLISTTQSASFIDLSYKNSAELNSQNVYNTSLVNSSGKYENYIIPVSKIPEIYFFKNSSESFRQVYNVVLNDSNYPNIDKSDPSSLRFNPSYIYEHFSLTTSSVSSPQLQNGIYNTFTHDLGLNRNTEKISGKKPWYDSYEHFYDDVKKISNDNLKTYSKISEFKISDKIINLVSDYGGDSTKITLNHYNSTEILKHKDTLEKQNSHLCFQNQINIVVSGIKKLLPYNGFYPQDRSLQLINYLKESYLDTNAIKGGLLLVNSSGEQVKYDDQDKLIEFYRQSSFLEPLYSPGIFYNLIKSGIAVDWTLYTGSIPYGDTFVPIKKFPDYKISFESLLDLKDIPISSSDKIKENRIMKMKEIDYPFSANDYGGLGSFFSFQGFFERKTEGSKLYSLSINNFLAETIKFFLKDSKLSSFISKPDSEFSVFESSKTYYMNVVLKKKDLIMCEAHSSSLAYNFGKMSGRYFGPSFWTGSSGDKTRITDSGLLSEALRDPGYCMYTPPYYYGDAISRLSFTPYDGNRKYSLDEIFSNIKIENLNTGFVDDTVYASGSLYSSFVMPVESSVKIKGLIEERQQTVDLSNLNNGILDTLRNNLQNSTVGTATNITGIKKWVISTKMEAPVLDFSNQDFITSSNLLSSSYTDELLKSEEIYHTPPTGSGFGRGMWSGYGELPIGDKGIFVELKESYPRELIGRYNPTTQTFTETNTGSLLQACGFQQVNSELSKKVGELADSREISEAIVIIPYSNNRRVTQNARIDEDHFLDVNDTVNIEGHNFFKINEEMFNTQLGNISSGKAAVLSGQFGLTGDIKETSISKMIQKMSKYVLPPNFDFLINRDIKPFVMYIAEFTSTLDKQDLADIWQGVMPKIAMRAEREQQVVSHQNSLYDFFHGKGLPEDVKFMIFKAKKRAEINYYKMTADSTDDGLFPSIQAGKPPSPYSFNWPYDYCSLVETARVDVEIEYLSGSNNI